VLTVVWRPVFSLPCQLQVLKAASVISLSYGLPNVAVTSSLQGELLSQFAKMEAA
jgi:hypothetical protein